MKDEQCCIIFSFGSHSTFFMVQPILSNKRNFFSLGRTAQLHAAPNVLSVDDTYMLSHDHQLFIDWLIMTPLISIIYFLLMVIN